MWWQHEQITGHGIWRTGDLEEVQEVLQHLTFAVTAWLAGNPMWYDKPCCHTGDLSSVVLYMCTAGAGTGC
jgi:hypothetical protein